MFFPSSLLDSKPTDVGLQYNDVWLQAGQHGWWIPPVGQSANQSKLDLPVLLYLHGNGSNLGDLPHRLQQFNRWGYGVLAIDYRGYGQSTGPFPNEQRVYEDAASAWRYLTKQRGIPAERIVLYGRSIGGAIAIHLAMTQTDVAGVILESTFTSMQAMVSHYLPLPILPVAQLLTQRFDSLAKVRSLCVPILFMHGTADRVVPAAMSQHLYEAARAEHKTLIWIDNAGHSNLPTVGGERYNQAVRTFMARYAESR